MVWDGNQKTSPQTFRRAPNPGRISGRAPKSAQQMVRESSKTSPAPTQVGSTQKRSGKAPRPAKKWSGEPRHQTGFGQVKAKNSRSKLSVKTQVKTIGQPRRAPRNGLGKSQNQPRNGGAKAPNEFGQIKTKHSGQNSGRNFQSKLRSKLFGTQAIYNFYKPETPKPYT